MKQPPHVTIGLVVRNGQAHLADAIESFLAQTLQDIEIVIYDNASTDETAVIAQRYAAIDSRVRLVRRPRNIGATANFIGAAEDAAGRYFCWAAHDDLRDPKFLETLAALLDAEPSAALACCCARNMDPDGAPKDLRRETLSLRTTRGMTAARRTRMYLREAPGTIFYGLFRTSMLKPALEMLRRETERDGNPLLGLDMVFLAHVVREHDLAVTHEPLLLFRRGGLSHRIDVYRSLRGYLRHTRRFAASLRRATCLPGASPIDRLSVLTARWWYLARYFLGRPMRLVTWHYLSGAIPGVMAAASWWASMTDPVMRNLRRRLRALPKGGRVAIFGAGKHTRRRLEAMKLAAGRGASFVGVIDDLAASASPIDGLPIVPPEMAGTLRPDVILVSSDTFEAGMIERARQIAPPGIAVWCIYDTALETASPRRSEASTPAMKRSNSAKPSSVAAMSSVADG